MKHYSIDNFCQMLGKVDWYEVLKLDDIDLAWSKFKEFFIGTIDTITPEKTIRTKKRTEPGFNGDILEAIQKRDKAYKTFLKSRSDNDYKVFTTYRNKCTNLIRSTKISFFKDKIHDEQGNPKKLWNTLKDLGKSNKVKTKSSNIGLNINDQVCFDKKTVTNTFNQFFTTIASNLLNKLPVSKNIYTFDHIREFYSKKGVKSNNFKLSIVSEETVIKILSKMCAHKATGIDKLPAKFIKDGAKYIVSPITHLVNLSIHTCSLPTDLKTARVTPIYKKGLKSDPGNYRPVSVLLVVSKVLERIVYNQVNDYLKQNKLLYDLQSGFRDRYSTDTCLIYLTDFIRMQTDAGSYTGMALLDLQKAFDTVDHGILLNKLEAIGMSVESVIGSDHTCAEYNSWSASMIIAQNYSL